MKNNIDTQAQPGKPASSEDSAVLPVSVEESAEEENPDFAEEFTTSGTDKQNWEKPAKTEGGGFLI